MFMKKFFLMAAVAALTLASCSSDEELALNDGQEQAAEAGAVSFDVYTQRGVTRAGTPGSIDNTSIKTGAHAADGFGVFGYYTDNTDYTQYATPNFFYNQRVHWDGSAWTYEPVKYWPNEFGSSAISDDVDKVTFFAYAPWIDVTPSSGQPTGSREANITQISKNTATGDPIIKYVVDTDPTTSVDLLWGVVSNPNDYLAVDNVVAAPSLEAGLPFIDMVKEAVTNKIKFQLNHALAKLNVQIDAIVDDFVASKALNANTRIYVRSITIGGIALKGALNLNNTSANEPLWYDYDGTKELSANDVTFYDGRKDGKEATANGEQKSEKPAALNTKIIQLSGCFAPAADAVLYTAEEAAAYNATLTGALAGGASLSSLDLVNAVNAAIGSSYSYNPFSPQTISDEDAAAYNATLTGAVAAGDVKTLAHGAQYSASANPGVNETAVNLFKTSANADGYIFVIPTGDDMNVTIVYDVETIDDNLSGTLADGVTHGTSVENRIYKENIFATGIEAGKQYQLKLHLGMTSVKFDATVTDWVEEDAQDVDLPYNGLTLTAAATTAVHDVWVDAAETSYQFQVIGLDASEWITYTNDNTQVTALTGEAASSASGKVIATATLTANTTFKNITTGTAKVATSTKSAQVNFTQRAAALGLTVSGQNESADLSLTKTATNAWTDVTADADHIKVWKNGTPMIYVSGTPSGNQFTFDASNNKITLGTNAATNDKYKVYIKAGDAEAETVEITI